ncbi:MAG: anaerobic ribonucleoside-triphosphate reductase activating protein [Propioniciclava sp.]|uniref:anaerobic ribonucleoside-triphosphate reductase activating protein n=1 Tax=Propioniciclava sp. TaxID=2038686 RepID=UPI0039E3FA60
MTSPDALAIAGLTRMSSCDWPGKLVATLFLQGCPWRCGYCHNRDLLDPATPGVVTWGEVRSLLARRRGLLDGVVFSGGEPTRQDALVAAASQVRDQGFGVGLHTAGAYPRKLARLLPLLDWIGLDIKALPARYGAITGVEASGAKAAESLALVVASGVDHEVRITVDPDIHDLAHVTDLVAWVRAAGARRIVLQQARADGASAAFAARLGGRVLADVVPKVPDGVLVRR